MPTKTTETSLMLPGCLVETTHEVRAVPPFETVSGTAEYSVGLPAGTVGLIIALPQGDRPRQYLIQFVGGQEWWMYTNEIAPHLS